jgi:hypothetical protein
MSLLHYCKGWFRAKKLALGAYSASEALARHNDGDLYCVLVGSVDAPKCFLEIGKGFAGVSFLDDRLRENLSYNFQELEPGRLFLTMAVWRNFVGDTDAVAKGTTYTFDPSGQIHMQEESFYPQHSLTRSARHSDVSSNWDTVPAFGNYSQLARVKR